MIFFLSCKKHNFLFIRRGLRQLVVRRCHCQCGGFMWTPFDRRDGMFVVFKMRYNRISFLPIIDGKECMKKVTKGSICLYGADGIRVLYGLTLSNRRSRIENVPSSHPDANMQLASLMTWHNHISHIQKEITRTEVDTKNFTTCSTK